MNTLADILEQGIIGDFLDVDGAAFVEGRAKCLLKRNITKDFFQTGNGRKAFEALTKALATTNDPILLGEAVADAVGADYANKAILRSSPKPHDFDTRITALIAAYNKRQLIDVRKTANEVIDEAINNGGKAEDAISLLAAKLKYKADEMVKTGSFDEDIIDFAEIIPEEPNENDPEMLFKNGWLYKGDGLEVVASTGVGKSVLSIQLAYAWALGRAAFGIQPTRPLKIGILQTEDRYQKLQLIKLNMIKGYQKHEKWTAEDFEKAEKNMITRRDVLCLSGKDFVDYLAKFQRQKRCDLIIINPLQGVFGDGDLSKNDDMRHFLIDLINPVINAKCAENDEKCALLIINHTTKLPTGRNAWLGAGSAENSEYYGMGSGSFVNWARKKLVILPVPRKPGVFDLVAAKSDAEIGWKNKEGDKSVKLHKWIAHSSDEGLIFWKEVSVELPVKKKKKDSDKRSSDAKGSDPKKIDAENLASIYKKAIESDERITLSKARDLLTQSDFKCSKRGKDAHAEILKNPQKYGLQVIPTGKKNEKVITTAAQTK